MIEVECDLCGREIEYDEKLSDRASGYPESCIKQWLSTEFQLEYTFRPVAVPKCSDYKINGDVLDICKICGEKIANGIGDLIDTLKSKRKKND